MDTTIATDSLNIKVPELPVDAFFKDIGLPSILKTLGFRKKEGLGILEIMKLLLNMVFYQKPWNRICHDPQHAGSVPGKDVVYRFLNSDRHDWETLQGHVARNCIEMTDRLNNRSSTKALIFDDTFYDRTRSKNVELLSRIHDHCDGKSKKGFSLLTAAWSDSVTTIPFDFRLLSSSKPVKPLEEKTETGLTELQNKRRADARKEKPALMIEMIKNAIGFKIPFDYVLFDSWFAYPSIISSVNNCKTDVICMLKNIKTVNYRYQDKIMSLDRIHALIKDRLTKRTPNVRVNIEIFDKENDRYIPAVIVFVKTEKGRQWIALLSTSRKITNEKIIEIYGIRWDIEVFFKIAKSFLKLAKEFSGRSYDMLCCHTVIVFIRHMMLSICNRNNVDERSIGDLFFHNCDEVKKLGFAEALIRIFEMLMEFLSGATGEPITAIKALIDLFFSKLPRDIRGFFNFETCET